MSPIERAARALSARIYGNEREWKECVDDARALLQAIREPSEGMLQAGGENIVYSDEDISGHLSEAAAVWQAMIDRALSE